MSFLDALKRKYQTPGYAGGTLEDQLARQSQEGMDRLGYGGGGVALNQSPQGQVLTPQNQQAVTHPRVVRQNPDSLTTPASTAITVTKGGFPSVELREIPEAQRRVGEPADQFLRRVNVQNDIMGNTGMEQQYRDDLENAPLRPVNPFATRPRLATALQPDQSVTEGQPSFRDAFATRQRRTQPRDYLADDAQYLRDLRTQPRSKKEIAMGIIDAVNAGFGNKPRTTLTKRERALQDAEGNLGLDVELQKQAQSQMVPVTLDDGTVVQVPAKGAGSLQSQQQRIRQQSAESERRREIDKNRVAHWGNMDSASRKRLIAGLYGSGALNSPDLLEYAADELGVPAPLREKFISGQMRDAVDAEGNLIQVNRQTQEVFPVGVKSYETTKEAGKSQRFAEGQAGATQRAGMRGSAPRSPSTDKAAMRRSAALVATIDRARNEMEAADKSGDKTKREQARVIGEQAASELNALGAGYEAGRGEGGYPYYKKVEGQPTQGGQYAGKRISKANVAVYGQRHGMTPEAAAQYLAGQGATIY